jgi:cyclophilin family peptidyl-prolyl cis-trans isomerase
MRGKMRVSDLVVLICVSPILCSGCSLLGIGSSPPVVEVEVSIDSEDMRFQVELDPDKAPLTVENFLRYVDDGFYEGLIFHRVIPGFVIQAGGHSEDMERVTPTYPPIPLEAQSGLLNARGTIAMARTGDPNSATSQFFINLEDNTSLDYAEPDRDGYAVFGRVIKGMDVVDLIAAVPTGTVSSMSNVPTKTVLIRAIKRLRPS